MAPELQLESATTKDLWKITGKCLTREKKPRDKLQTAKVIQGETAHEEIASGAMVTPRQVYVVKPVEDDRWSTLTAEHPSASLFHSVAG